MIEIHSFINHNHRLAVDIRGKINAFCENQLAIQNYRKEYCIFIIIYNFVIHCLISKSHNKLMNTHNFFSQRAIYCYYTEDMAIHDIAFLKSKILEFQHGSRSMTQYPCLTKFKIIYICFEFYKAQVKQQKFPKNNFTCP